MIIGEKTKFAVEFYALLDTIPPLGRICYWIDGEAYGDIELISTLGLLLGGLNAEKQNIKLFLEKNIQDEGLDKKDFDDMLRQYLSQKTLRNRDIAVLMLISPIFKISFAISPIKFIISWSNIPNSPSMRHRDTSYVLLDL